MMNKPFVSILIPVYCAEKYLSRCLDSILSQNFQDMEVILVNDASPDNSLQIMREYAAKDPRFKIINHDKNYGRVKARNTGIEAASGEYIVFCDDDDELFPDFLRSAHKYSCSGDYDIIHFGTVIADTHSLRVHGIFEVYRLPHGKILHDQEIFDTYFLKNKIRCNLWGNLLKADLVRKYQLPIFPHCTNEDFLRMTHLLYYARTFLYVRERAYRYHYGTGIYGRKAYTLFQFRQFVNDIETYRALAHFFQRVSLPHVYHNTLNAKMSESCLYILEILRRLPAEEQEQGMNLLFTVWGKEELIKTCLLQYHKIADSVPGKIRASLCVLYDILKYYVPSLVNRFEWRKNR